MVWTLGVPAQNSVPNGHATMRPSELWKHGVPMQLGQSIGQQGQSGTTANDIMRQNYERAGLPYGYGGDPASTQSFNEERIRAQMAKDPAYNPSLQNGIATKPFTSPNQELQQLIETERQQENPYRSLQELSEGYYDSPEFATATKRYADALQQITEMLEGKRKISLADAFFSIEDAYGETYLNKIEYQKKITALASFIRVWMAENDLDVHNSDDVHLAIQKAINQELTITAVKTSIDKRQFIDMGSGHKPFSYDFKDNTGEKDYRNAFVTKCLATGTGQCASLPIVYLLLAEALGTTAYLSIAPQHTFIKYRDKDGNIVNYEPTTG